MTTTVTAENQFLTLADTSHYLGVSLDTIRGLLRADKLPARKIGRRWYVERARLDQMVRPPIA